MSTEGFGAALLNILHGTPMTGQHAGTEFQAVCRSVAAEDLRQFDHAR